MSQYIIFIAKPQMNVVILPLSISKLGMRNWICRPVRYAKGVTQTVTVGLQQGDRLLALWDNNIYSPDNGG
jgi:hypothetical protein